MCVLNKAISSGHSGTLCLALHFGSLWVLPDLFNFCELGREKEWKEKHLILTVKPKGGESGKDTRMRKEK
jgi:hypothetical protein